MYASNYVCTKGKFVGSDSATSPIPQTLQATRPFRSERLLAFDGREKRKRFISSLQLGALSMLSAAKLAFFFVVQALYIRLAFYAILQQGSLSIRAAAKLSFFMVQAIYVSLVNSSDNCRKGELVLNKMGSL